MSSYDCPHTVPHTSTRDASSLVGPETRSDCTKSTSSTAAESLDVFGFVAFGFFTLASACVLDVFARLIFASLFLESFFASRYNVVFLYFLFIMHMFFLMEAG